MTPRTPVKPANAPRLLHKPRGKPFQPGSDPRRLTDGHKNNEAKDLARAIKAALAEEGFKGERFRKLVLTIWAKALAGYPWAVEMLLDRIAGKVTQPIDDRVSGIVTFIMPRPAPKPEEKK